MYFIKLAIIDCLISGNRTKMLKEQPFKKIDFNVYSYLYQDIAQPMLQKSKNKTKSGIRDWSTTKIGAFALILSIFYLPKILCFIQIFFQQKNTEIKKCIDIIN